MTLAETTQKYFDVRCLLQKKHYEMLYFKFSKKVKTGIKCSIEVTLTPHKKPVNVISRFFISFAYMMQS